MTKTYLIWDFDGTLYDSYPQIAAAMVAAVRDLGFQADEKEAYSLAKITVYHAAQTYAERFGLSVESLMAAFYRRHNEQRDFPLMAGAADCLRAVCKLGCRNYLFTHRDRVAVSQLTADRLVGFFDDFVTREDGFTDKPSPEAVLYLMRKHVFTAEEAFMIGDRDIDILSGQAVGVAGILLDEGGFYPQVRSEYRVKSLAEIPILLTR
jgi:HAD superfamily hydrolase (TIGR01549 family)